MSMQSDSLDFPEWFPEDCPPGDSVETSGTIYRFVSSNPVGPNDFLSYHETGERPNSSPCQHCGLSVFRRLDDVRGLLRHLWKTYPGKSYGPHIVKRDLVPTDGRIKATGTRGHHTWWAYEGIERHASFEYVEAVNKS